MEIQNNHLIIGGCDAVSLAKKYGTPLYVFNEEVFVKKVSAYKKALASSQDGGIIYAGKALLNVAICKKVDQLGLYLDVVSGGELYTALAADFPPERIFFHGNNKSAEELVMALDCGVGRIVVDNLQELEALSRLATDKGKAPRILLRVTPGVEAHTHSYIQTGQLDSKFGVPLANGMALDALAQAAQTPNVELVGVHCHIGSQIFDFAGFAVAVDLMLGLMKEALNRGIHLKELDLGGGLGIRHTKDDDPLDIAEFMGQLVTEMRSKAEELGLAYPNLFVEPGRSLVGEAGTTLYTVGYIKDIPGVRCYAAVDGGMGDNPRVALYQAKYEAIVANRVNDSANCTYSIAGKCCESGDMLIFDGKFPELKCGDILAVFSTGAYNYSMASNYNMLPRPAMINVYRGESELIVARQSYADLLQNQYIPERWQEEAAQAAPESVLHGRSEKDAAFTES